MEKDYMDEDSDDGPFSDDDPSNEDNPSEEEEDKSD